MHKVVRLFFYFLQVVAEHCYGWDVCPSLSVRPSHAGTVSKQESPAVADKPARRLRKVSTVYVRAVGL